MRYHHLTLQQRYIIQDLRELGKNFEFIAGEIGVSRSTVCREIQRNSNSKGGYRALGAQSVSKTRRPHLIAYPRKINGPLEELIVQKLEDGWSPEQIHGRLKLVKKPTVSVVGIYRFISMNRCCGGKLYRLLRRAGRKQRRGFRRSQRWIKIESRRFIDERSIEANNRLTLGHWERDLVHGTRQGPALLTIVDRKSRYTLLEKVANRAHQESATKTKAAFSRTGLSCASMTNDNGAEFGAFHSLERDLKSKIYFTHPYCSWERGTNENTNGLIRQYLPKGKGMGYLTEDHLRELENILNQRPRKTLGYRTPEEAHFSKRTKLINGLRKYSDDKHLRFVNETHLLFVALRA